MPFAEPEAVDPASVMTCPVETVMMRTMWLLLSATAMREPSCENATSDVDLKEAAGPTPSAEP